MKDVYKYRTCFGIVRYNIIKGDFGDVTMQLRDTSCNHFGPNCVIEVVKCDDSNSYAYSKPLNDNAKEYYHFHNREHFWATEEEAYIENLYECLDINRKEIAKYETEILEAKAELANMKTKNVHYLSTAVVKVDEQYYVENEGYVKIIGSIQFANGNIGYLTNSNYSYNDYIDGDRIILIENSNGNGRLTTEDGGSVFLTENDLKNRDNNDRMLTIQKSIESKENAIDRYNKKTEIIHQIINSYNDNHLTYKEMVEMLEIKLKK